MRGFFYLNTDNVHAPANLSHSHNSASMYPSQLRGGSSQMLLLKWRYVNQGNLEITLTVTWVGLLGSWTGTQTETDRGLPAGFAELCCFFLLLFFFQMSEGHFCFCSIYSGNHTKRACDAGYCVRQMSETWTRRCCKHCGTLSALPCWLTEWP